MALLSLRTAASRDRAYLRASSTWAAVFPDSTLPTQASKVLEQRGLIGPAIVDVEPGIRMRLDPFDLVPRVILTTGSWEPETWSAVEPHLPQGGTFVDVGAHIGYYSLKAAKLLGKEGMVISIEPNPRTVEELRANIALSNATQIHVEPVACAAVRTKIELFMSPRANTGMTSLSRETAATYGPLTSAVQVDAVPLDEIISRISPKRVDLIKMDIEGSELNALRGSMETLKRYRPVLALEVVDDHLRNMGASEQILREFLAAQNYVEKAAVETNVIWTPR